MSTSFFVLFVFCFKEKRFWFADHFGKTKCLMSLLPFLFLSNKINITKEKQYLFEKIFTLGTCYNSLESSQLKNMFLFHWFCARTIFSPWSLWLKNLLQGKCFLPECFWAIWHYMWAHCSLVYVYNDEQCSWRTHGLVRRFYSWRQSFLTQIILYTIFCLAWKLRKWLIVIASREL